MRVELDNYDDSVSAGEVSEAEEMAQELTAYIESLHVKGWN